MSEKTFELVSAGIDEDEKYRRTGKVKLRGVPTWLKSRQFITATLTPTQARKLAIELLQSAERVDDGAS